MAAAHQKGIRDGLKADVLIIIFMDIAVYLADQAALSSGKIFPQPQIKGKIFPQGLIDAEKGFRGFDGGIKAFIRLLHLPFVHHIHLLDIRGQYGINRQHIFLKDMKRLTAFDKRGAIVLQHP